MSAGLYNKTVVISRPETLKNEYGEEETRLVDKYKTKVRIVHQKGSIDVENSEILHNYTKTVEMYRFVDVKDTDILKFDDHQWRILDLDDSRELNKKTLVIEQVNE